jgi:glycosyltransferase involved in cell wall biosynthesis
MTLHRARPGTSDLANLFRDADLFCLPTAWDAVPWAVLEAEASGLPIVSTSVGSIPELVPDGCGRIVPPDDVPALREALAGLVEDDRSAATLAAMGTCARARVEETYDAGRNTARLVELLCSVAR